MDETPAEQPKRAFIYLRISEDKTGEKAGVERQLEDCTALAKRERATVVEVFCDNDISAYSGKRRPDFENLLDAMKNEPGALVICWHTDRLYRSMKDLERFIEIAEAARISIKSVTSGELDLS